MKIDPDSVPSTIEKAVMQIVESLDHVDVEAVLKSQNSYGVHHTVGRYLRNE